MDLLALGSLVAGRAACFIFGGTHFESVSQVGLVGDFGGLIHLEVFGALDGSDGHCHDEGGGGGGAGVLQFGSFADLGAGVGVGVAAVDFLGFKATLLGQLNFKFGGLFDLYFGVAVVVVVDVLLLSEELLEASLL